MALNLLQTTESDGELMDIMAMMISRILTTHILFSNLHVLTLSPGIWSTSTIKK